MMDVVRKNGDKIDVAELSRQLGCPVVEVSALKGDGVGGKPPRPPSVPRRAARPS